MRDQNIVIVAHKFLTQPDDDLIIFLNREKYKNVLHIRHSFSDAPGRKSYYTWYKKGGIYKEHVSRNYQCLPEPLIYVKEFYFTWKWIWQSKIVWDKYIGMDGLCVYWGNMLRSFKKVSKTIFWAIDFVPKDRFKQRIKNRIYHWINIKSYKKSDEMWDLSSRMVKARKHFLDIDVTDYRVHKVVPYGAWCDRVKRYTYDECQQRTLVFMGHLLKKQGVQLVMQAIPLVIKKIPGFRFKIIGNGQYREDLIKLAKSLGVMQYCDFKGKIENYRELEDEVAKSCLAIAPYVKKFDKWTYYTDPGKVKTYLTCGLPLLLTDIPWNAKEIEENKCGMIISEQPIDIANKIVFLMNDELINQTYRDNAIRYAQRFNYEKIFRELSL